MSKACVIVADVARARFLCLAASDGRKPGLVEGSVIVNPETEGASTNGCNRAKGSGPGLHARDAAGPEKGRKQGRIDPRAFGSQIARQAALRTQGWKGGVVLLIAERRLLAFLRQGLREALGPAVVLKELARNYSNLTPAELEDRLDLGALIARRGSPE